MCPHKSIYRIILKPKTGNVYQLVIRVCGQHYECELCWGAFSGGDR